MSKWYEPKLSDIEYDEDSEEFYAWIDKDDFGNVYVSIKLSKINELMNIHAQALGRMKTKKKARSSRKNGKLGGRPKKKLSTVDV